MLSDPQFWVLVAFIIFIGLIFKPVKKNLTSNLDIKINEIKDSLNQAEKIKNDAQQTLSEIKKRQNDVKQEIIVIQQEAKEKITTIEQTANQKLNEKIKKRGEIANVKINQLTRDANLEIQRYVIQNTINATIKILEKKLDPSEKQNLINNSIAELNSTLKH